MVAKNTQFYGPKSIKDGYSVKVKGFGYDDLLHFQTNPFT